jgi:hypothetical protein
MLSDFEAMGTWNDSRTSLAWPVGTGRRWASTLSRLSSTDAVCCAITRPGLTLLRRFAHVSAMGVIEEHIFAMPRSLARIGVPVSCFQAAVRFVISEQRSPDSILAGSLED